MIWKPACPTASQVSIVLIFNARQSRASARARGAFVLNQNNIHGNEPTINAQRESNTYTWYRKVPRGCIVCETVAKVPKLSN